MHTALSPLPQQGTATKAPAPPPIPAMPSTPGASTGGTTPQATTVGGQGGAVGGGSGGGKSGPADLVIVPPVGPVVAGDGSFSTGQPPIIPVDPNQMDRDAQPIFAMALGAIVIMFIGFPLLRAFIRRGEKKLELSAVRAGDLQPQIRQLQESIDAMAIELERISEAQRFQAKLMSERAGAQLPGERR